MISRPPIEDIPLEPPGRVRYTAANAPTSPCGASHRPLDEGGETYPTAPAGRSGDGSTSSLEEALKLAAGCAETCDCELCRRMYRQGRMLASVNHATAAAAWCIILGLTIFLGGLIWLLTH